MYSEDIGRMMKSFTNVETLGLSFCTTYNIDFVKAVVNLM